MLNKGFKIYLFLLLLLPVFSFLSFNRLGSWTAQSLMKFILIIFGIAFLFLSKKLRFSRTITFSFLWVLYYSISGFLVGFENDLLKVFNNSHLAFLLILIIIHNSWFSEDFIKNAIGIIKVTVIITAIFSMVQVFDSTFLSPHEVIETDDLQLFEDQYRIRRLSIFGLVEPNALGLSFLPLLSILIGYMLKVGDKRYYIYLILGGLIAILSNTRYIMAGFIILSFQILFTSRYRDKGLIRYIIIAVIGFVVLSNTIRIIGYDFQEWYDNRLFAEGSITESTRYKAWGTFIRFFPEHPILGTGKMTEEIIEASNEVGSSHIHVGYLSHLVSYGIFGCFFLFSFWILIARGLLKNARRTNYWGSFQSVLIFLVSFATMSQSSMFYCGIILALVFDRYFAMNLMPPVRPQNQLQ